MHSSRISVPLASFFASSPSLSFSPNPLMANIFSHMIVRNRMRPYVRFFHICTQQQKTATAGAIKMRFIAVLHTQKKQTEKEERGVEPSARNNSKLRAPHKLRTEWYGVGDGRLIRFLCTIYGCFIYISFFFSLSLSNQCEMHSATTTLRPV